MVDATQSQASLIERCLGVFWHEQFNFLTIDHPMRMAAVLALIADEVAPDEPEPHEAEDYPYERGWWGCSSLLRTQLLREVDNVVGPLLNPVSEDSEPEMPNPCDPIEQQKRQDFIDWLWERSGRREQGNMTYTGLYQEHLRAEAARLNEEPAA